MSNNKELIIKEKLVFVKLIKTFKLGFILFKNIWLYDIYCLNYHLVSDSQRIFEEVSICLLFKF